MKELMCAVVATVCVAGFAEITSSNIVGYSNQDKSGKQFVSLGSCFMNIGNDGQFKLSAITLDGGDAASDNIQVLESTKAAVSAAYCYISAAQAADFGDASYQGWWNLDMDTRMDDVSFPAGSAFLGNFGTKTVKPTFAGQVLDGSVELDCTGKQFVMFANPLPRDMKLGELVANGGDAASDNIQVLESTKAAGSAAYCYISAAQAADFGDASYQGWWNLDMDTRMDDVVVKPGEAFLANFGTKSVKLTFPQAIPAAQ